jgi:hypothetical protein
VCLFVVAHSLIVLSPNVVYVWVGEGGGGGGQSGSELCT